MNEEMEKKVEFIIDWFNQERQKFSFTKQVKLAKLWLEICTNGEEYEMASALQKEKEKVIIIYLKQKRKNRTYKQKLFYYLIIIKRKLRSNKKWLSNN